MGSGPLSRLVDEALAAADPGFIGLTQETDLRGSALT